MQNRASQKWSALGPFLYLRREYHSKILGNTVHLGLLRLSGREPTRDATTLYFLHGGNGDDRQFTELPIESLISKETLEREGKGGFQIVLPFVGTSFLAKKHSEYFLQEVKQWAEEDFPTAANRRSITGLSMGGQAALSVFFRNPSLFRAVGAHFPTLIRFNYENELETHRFSEQLQISPDALSILVTEFKRVFSNHSEFADYDPVELARKASSRELVGKRIYVDVGSKDQFGLHDGCEAFHQALKKGSIPHHFEIVENGMHDAEFVIRQGRKLFDFVLG